MLRIRLSRAGRKKQPFFKIVVIPRGAGTKSRNYKAEVGTHDPVNKETTINADVARKWLARGAQPTDTVHNLFVKHGIITGRKKEAHDKDPVEPEPKEEEQKEEEQPKETEEKQEKDDAKEEKEEEKKEEAEKEEAEEEEEDDDEEEKKEEKDEGDAEDDTDEEEEDDDEDKEGGDLESLDLTTRIINSLEDAGIDSVAKLKEKSEDDLSEVKGLGPKSIEKIMDAVK